MLSTDICSNFRPCTFSEVVGHKSVVSSLRAAVLNPNRSHIYLFSGDNGLGKTTLARILASAINCTSLQSNGDPCGKCESCTSIQRLSSQSYQEVDAADTNGVGEMRAIKSDLSMRSLFSNYKIFTIDECHCMTSQAQKSMLKILEDIPSSAFVILCTTAPEKLDRGILDRAEQYHLSRLSHEELSSHVRLIAAALQTDISPKVVDLVVGQAQGKPRRALKGLQKAINVGIDNLEGIKEILDFDEDANKESLDLFKALMDRSMGWSKVMGLYKKIGGEAESIRLSLAGLFRYNLERSLSNSNEILADSLGCFLKPLPYPKPENALIYSIYSVFCNFRGIK